MSIVFNEEDERGIEALQMLIDNGKSLPLSDSGKYTIEFEVKDHLKANNFIMDIFNISDEEERKRVEDIIGIHITSVGQSKTVDNAAIRELLIQAIEKLQ